MLQEIQSNWSFISTVIMCLALKHCGIQFQQSLHVLIQLSHHNVVCNLPSTLLDTSALLSNV